MEHPVRMRNTSVEVLDSVDDLRCLDSHSVMECRRRSRDLSFLANFARSLATVNQEKLTIKSYSLLDTYNRLGCFKNKKKLCVLCMYLI